MRPASPSRLLSLAVLPAALVGSSPAWACGGGFLVPQGTPEDDALYNRASHIVLAEGTDSAGLAQTTITIATDVVGDASGFGLVFPVPVALGPDQVALGEAEAISWVRGLTGIRMLEQTCSDLRPAMVYTCPPPNRNGSGAGGDGAGGELSQGGQSVTVTESWILGDFAVAALEADDGTELADWLRTEGLQVPAVMEPVLQDYIDEGMAFVTLRIPDGTEFAEDALLPPIQLRIPGALDRVPLKLGAATAREPMDVFFYTLDAFEPYGDDPLVAGISNIEEVEVEDGCFSREGGPTEAYAAAAGAAVDAAGGLGWVHTTTTAEGAAWEQWDGWGDWYETSLSAEGRTHLPQLGAAARTTQISRFHLRFGPGALVEDPVFYRSTYLDGAAHTYPPEFVAELTDYVPVCGEGLVHEGSCPPPVENDRYCDDDDEDDEDAKGSGCAVGPGAASLGLSLLALLPAVRRRRPHRT